MKKTVKIVAAVAASLVIASLCFAQVTEKTSQTEKTADMTSDMSSLMNEISGMMAKMAAMANDVNPENRKMMSGVMLNLSREMTNMSGMLRSGKMTDRELEKMHVRLMKTQRIVSELEMKK